MVYVYTLEVNIDDFEYKLYYLNNYNINMTFTGNTYVEDNVESSRIFQIVRLSVHQF